MGSIVQEETGKQLSTKDLLAMLQSTGNSLSAANRSGNEWVGAGSGALSGAATGASIGSAVPIIGTGLGAAVGGLAGGLMGYFGNKQGKEQVTPEMALQRKMLMDQYIKSKRADQWNNDFKHAMLGGV